MQLKPHCTLQDGKYEIIRPLGQGGFGITYLAEQTLMDRKVCIKEFFIKEFCERDEATSKVSLGTASNAEMMQRYMAKFIKEARTIAKLDHPNIVRIHDVFKENNTAYIVMEYIDGMSLGEYIKEHGPLAEEKAIPYIHRVCDALSFAHRQHIMHLDVKPSNIMLDQEHDRLVLIDFGLAKQYTEGGEQTSSTPVGLSQGYAPLEQYKAGGLKEFSPATDVYSLGATLYKLLTGETPPSASDVNEDGLPPLPPSISATTSQAIEKAMQPKRKDRPQSVEAFLALLEYAITDSNDVNHEEETLIPGNAIESDSVSGHGQKDVLPNPANESIRGSSISTNHSLPKWPWFTLAGIVLSAVIIFVLTGKGRRDNVLSSQETSPEPVVPGSLSLASTPSGASIWIDGKDMNQKTPVVISNLVPGEHSIQLILDGYGDVSEVLTIDSGKRSDFSRKLKKLTKGNENGHDWVDLGLSVKWATCNVGASSPYSDGKYYAWGETTTKENYSWSTLRYCSDDSGDSFTKYDYTSKGKNRLDSSDDVAHVRWGGKWRMPTAPEFNELISGCEISFVNQSNKNGYIFKSKKNANSIFLPASGRCLGYDVDSGRDLAYYWSSSLREGLLGEAECLSLSSSAYKTTPMFRVYGLPVRPVMK